MSKRPSRPKRTVSRPRERGHASGRARRQSVSSPSTPAVESPARTSGDEKPTGRSSSMLVVGIGASAGGLEALEQFFAAVPKDNGLAFVVVQHLERHHPSL